MFYVLIMSPLIFSVISEAKSLGLIVGSAAGGAVLLVALIVSICASYQYIGKRKKERHIETGN